MPRSVRPRTLSRAARAGIVATCALVLAGALGAQTRHAGGLTAFRPQNGALSRFSRILRTTP